MKENTSRFNTPLEMTPILNNMMDGMSGKVAQPFLKDADEVGRASNKGRKIAKEIPEYGRKMDYVFGQATGSKHNIDRSIAMEKQLNSIGIFDTKEGRKIVQDN